MGLKERSQQALVDMAGEVKKPEWKTWSFWIAVAALILGVIK